MGQLITTKSISQEKQYCPLSFLSESRIPLLSITCMVLRPGYITGQSPMPPGQSSQAVFFSSTKTMTKIKRETKTISS